MIRCSYSLHRLAPGCILALTAAACGGGGADDAAEDTPDTTTVAAPLTTRGPTAPPGTAGTLHLVGTTLHFAACNAAGDGTALEDGTGGEAAAIVQELGAGSAVTALVELDGNRLVALRYAAPEGPGCADLPPAADLEARGQEPFWFVSLSDSVATVRTPEEIDGVQYTAGQWTAIDATHWRYDARRDGEALVLELSRERCADGMSGARYPLRATLTRGGEPMQGCALEGRGAP